jgi:hypothetical protein
MGLNQKVLGAKEKMKNISSLTFCKSKLFFQAK